MGKSKSSALRKFSPKASPELDLKPIMNLMVVLIPMLLYSAQFIKFAALNITKASSGTGGEPTNKEDEDKKPPLKLKLKITSEGFVLEGAIFLDEEKVVAAPADDGTGNSQPVELYSIPLNQDLAESAIKKAKEDYAAKGRSIPREVEDMIQRVYSYDFVQLNSKIELVRQAVTTGGGENTFEKSDEIILASEADLPFELLIQSMDAVRCKFDKESKKFTACRPRSEQGKEDPNALYDNVVLDAGLLE